MTQSRESPSASHPSGSTEAQARALLARWTGIELPPCRSGWLARQLEPLLQSPDQPLERYLEDLGDRPSRSEPAQAFVDALTHRRGQFFARPEHHLALLRRIAPDLLRRGTGKMRVWKFGCGTGEGAYSLAITLLGGPCFERGLDPQVFATDLNRLAIAEAGRGHYPEAVAREVPQDHRRRFFLQGTGANRGLVSIRGELRQRIQFHHVNPLVDLPLPGLPQFDLIVCRGELPRFGPAARDRVAGELLRHLAPAGYLLTDPDEPLPAAWGRRLTPVEPGVLQNLAPAPPDSGPAPPAHAPSVPEQTLIIGDVKVLRGPGVLKTLLGSCVAACLYDPERQVGGMNHFSLPGGGDDQASARYGGFAMELLITDLMKQGARRDRLRAKVFGGSCVTAYQGTGPHDVGTRNALFVKQFLQEEGIPIEAECLGGEHGMMVRFHTDTGKAFAKPLATRALDPVVHHETRHVQEMMQKAITPTADGIELF